MTWEQRPCPIPGCEMTHPLVQSRRTSRSGEREPAVLGTPVDGARQSETPDGRLGAGVKAPRRQPVAPLRAGGSITTAADPLLVPELELVGGGHSFGER